MPLCVPSSGLVNCYFSLAPTDVLQVPQRLFYGPSRYREEFEELGILGRGGYGIVYQCRHRLDGNEYAVKKVPVSDAADVSLSCAAAQTITRP